MNGVSSGVRPVEQLSFGAIENVNSRGGNSLYGGINIR